MDAWGWCTGTTQRDGMGREEGGGFRMGNTCFKIIKLKIKKIIIKYIRIPNIHIYIYVHIKKEKEKKKNLTLKV